MGLTKTGTIGLIYSNRQGGRIEQLIQEAGSLVAVLACIFTPTSTRLSDAGLGSLVGTPRNLSTLSLSVMRWNMFYSYSNRQGG